MFLHLSHRWLYQSMAIACSVTMFSCAKFARASEPQQWSVHEIELTALEHYPNPYTDVVVTATFTGPDERSVTGGGFWDGGQTFRVRFTPPIPGGWSYSVVSEPIDQGLSRSGQLQVSTRLPKSHGFLRRDVEYPTNFSLVAGDRGEAVSEGTMTRGERSRFRLTEDGRVVVDEARSTYDDYIESFYTFQHDVVQAWLASTPVPQPASDNLAALETTLAAYRAVDSGQTISRC